MPQPLTAERIREIKPGTALDRLVAEHVMLFQHDHRAIRIAPGVVQTCPICDPVRYSTDIAKAQEVLAKMRERLKYLSILGADGSVRADDICRAALLAIVADPLPAGSGAEQPRRPDDAIDNLARRAGRDKLKHHTEVRSMTTDELLDFLTDTDPAFAEWWLDEYGPEAAQAVDRDHLIRDLACMSAAWEAAREYERTLLLGLSANDPKPNAVVG